MLNTTVRDIALMEALSAVPDPRKARGKQYSWILLLTLVSSALASGERSGHGIASWVAEHAAALLAWLHPERDRLPSESTLRRALRHVDVVALEQRLAQYTPVQSPLQRSHRLLSSAHRAKSYKVRHLMAKPYVVPARTVSPPSGQSGAAHQCDNARSSCGRAETQ